MIYIVILHIGIYNTTINETTTVFNETTGRGHFAENNSAR